MPYAIATITPFESKDEFDSGDYHVTLDRCLDEIGWAEKAKLQGKLIDGRYHGLARRLLHRGRRRRAEGKRAARARAGRHDFGLSSARRRSARGRDGVRADRRRRARNADGPHPRRLSRLDRLRQRRLRRLSLALGRDGRLGACSMPPASCARRSAPRRRKRLGCDAARSRSSKDEKAAGPGGKSIALGRTSPRHLGRRRVPQPEAHLYLRRPCRPRGGRPQDRPCRAHRLRGGGGCAAASSIR